MGGAMTDGGTVYLESGHGDETLKGPRRVSVIRWDEKPTVMVVIRRYSATARAVFTAEHLSRGRMDTRRATRALNNLWTQY
ncbi:MAG: hypothetical protein CM1200mP36_05750 [Gammaproteobacteria bacterium]|nr:MAG: hypothetical protein CM1200mP36_05750 [Gammaproteobacteria bacterium]